MTVLPKYYSKSCSSSTGAQHPHPRPDLRYTAAFTVSREVRMVIRSNPTCCGSTAYDSQHEDAPLRTARPSPPNLPANAHHDGPSLVIFLRPCQTLRSIFTTATGSPAVFSTAQ